MGTTSNDNNTLHTEVAVPLKYLSNFCRLLKECIISEIAIISRVVANPDADSKFMTTKLNIVKEQSNAIYDAGNEII